jgi:hypothetical protein
MIQPKFKVDGWGVLQEHISAGEITEDWDLPANEEDEEE